ncbi:AAA domain-containing protein [Halocella sp. SP3-1]|uniref:AAA domain-containing protein n=1 Tax=Halocella sp. SP3-1 TaxID=2382161 RepID=UPI000F7505F5|nr:AAA domain-containing protein [Halocella sp. SP3-1]AZO94550.1 DUF2726 domain-containing protein [Halocella sp. SP3-1]
MDQNKYLIILKGEDRTKDIVFFEKQGQRIKIKFRGSKVYGYSIKNVNIKKNPISLDITNKAVYCEDVPIYNVEQVLNFNGKVKIIYNKGKSIICDLKSLRIENNSINTAAVKNILEYWTEISQYTNTDDESESFLKKEYEKLKFISPRSILSSYINKDHLKTSSYKNKIIFPFKFNLSQKQALKNALKNNISIIEGPPGTGKTQTILNIIANLVIQDKTVAVVSGNNAAVQNVRDKLEAKKYNFFVASLGKYKNKEKFFNKLPKFDVPANWKSEIEENILLKKINKLNKRIDYLLDLNNKKAKMQQKLSAYIMEKQHFDVYYENQRISEIKQLSFYRKTPEKIISFLVDNYFAKEKKKSYSIFYKLKILFKYGFSDFKNLKTKEMDIILNLQREYYELKIDFLEKGIENLQNQLKNCLFDKLIKQHEEYSIALFKHKLYKKYHSKKKINLNIHTYKKNFNEFINNFPVILSTTHSLRNCIPENYLFDYMIIDESSQVDLLSGALALSCCKNVIIVGDMRQLPQIVDDSIQDKIKNYKIEDTYNYFKHNILSSMYFLYKEKLSKVILREHYRCHPKIIEFCNQKYYDGELIPFTKEDENDDSLILYRTSKGNHMRTVTRGEKKGKFNQREIDVTVEEILENPILCTGNNLDIGFTTPYRKQVEKANSVLNKEIECDTIHKYQGREKEIMIMSTVLDKTHFGKIGISFVDDPCKINVAVSRAKKRFVLVTDNSLFNKYGKEVKGLINYIEYNTLDKNVINSEIVSVFDLFYQEYSEKLISFKRRLLKKLKYKSENIMYILLNDIISDVKYNNLKVATQVLLKNLLKKTDKLNEDEKKYVNHNASVDFVIYNKLNKYPILIIEVDGFAFHENNPRQLERDKIKNAVLNKYNLHFLRLATTGSGERSKIISKLDELL